ncbi:MAG TPA: histidine phosphatase family protein [Phenylobacterium sp.]
MELVLIRHGLPERRDDTDDPPLSSEGHQQSERVARWLAADRVDVVVTSPMLRAVQTAEPYLRLSGLEPEVHTDIVEFDRGSGAYVPFEVLKREDYAAWQALVAGEGVDIAAFHKLVVAALEQIIASHSGRNVAVFCHGGVINVWTAHVLGLAPRLFFEPGYASIHRYLCARSGQRNVVSLNERAHLREDVARLVAAQ